MQTSDNGIRRIKQYEGFSAIPYKCPAGRMTIGYGHKILAGELFTSVTKAQAETLLRGDLRAAEQAVTELVKVPLNQNQFDALVSFTYNLGRSRLEESTLLQLLNSGNVDAASRQFTRWVYVGTTRSDGLVSRREAEQSLFQTTSTDIS